MRCGIAILTATVVLAFSYPACSQDSSNASVADDAADKALRREYDTEATARVRKMLKALEDKAAALAEFETAITNAEKVISEATVNWDAIRKNLETETKAITENLIAPQAAEGEPGRSARDALVKKILDAIVQLESEKPYRLAPDEASSLEQQDKPQPVRSVADDTDRLRWLEQQLMVADQLAKDSTPSILANSNARRSDSLAFIKEQLGVEKMVEKDQQPILDALKTLQPGEFK